MKDLSKNKTQKALQWIIDHLDELSVPYLVVGGLAARCYGSTRPLHDIDFYTTTEGLGKISKKLQTYAVFPPKHYRDEHWDIVFMQLSYQQQLIEFGDAQQSWYYDQNTDEWIKADINIDNAVTITYLDIELPVIPKSDLIAYKKRLDRPVDRSDIEQIV
ncbi:MAG: hypothetical protein ACQETE_11435 [Bacteroidota bacterium]